MRAVFGSQVREMATSDRASSLVADLPQGTFLVVFTVDGEVTGIVLDNLDVVEVPEDLEGALRAVADPRLVIPTRDMGGRIVELEVSGQHGQVQFRRPRDVYVSDSKLEAWVEFVQSCG